MDGFGLLSMRFMHFHSEDTFSIIPWMQTRYLVLGLRFLIFKSPLSTDCENTNCYFNGSYSSSWYSLIGLSHV